MSQMLHGAGIFTYIYPQNSSNVGKYSLKQHVGMYTVKYLNIKQWEFGIRRGVSSRPKLRVQHSNSSQTLKFFIAVMVSLQRSIGFCIAYIYLYRYLYIYRII